MWGKRRTGPSRDPTIETISGHPSAQTPRHLDGNVTSPPGDGCAPRAGDASRTAAPASRAAPFQPRGLIQPEVRGRVVRGAHRGGRRLELRERGDRPRRIARASPLVRRPGTRGCGTPPAGSTARRSAPGSEDPAKMIADAAHHRSLPRLPRNPPHHHIRMRTRPGAPRHPRASRRPCPRGCRDRGRAPSRARSPSSSTRFIVSRSPCVTATWLCSGSRPVAKALGALSGTIQTFGVGVPAAIASPRRGCGAWGRLPSRPPSLAWRRARCDPRRSRSPGTSRRRRSARSRAPPVRCPSGDRAHSRRRPTGGRRARTGSVLRLFAAICSYTG